MKPVLEEALEQIKGPAKKPQPPPTAGLKEQIDPGKLVADSLRQALGFGGDKPIPNQEELSQMAKKDEQQKSQELTQIQQVLEKEKQDQKPKANIEIIRPVSKPPPKAPPSYISGKPGFDPEKQAREEKEKKQHPLPPPPKLWSKPRRGSWTESLERKTKGAEIKGGRE